MARKEHILTHKAIGTWVVKTNLMSDYIGDLDDLLPVYDSNYADSNIVSALNFTENVADSVYNALFGPNPQTLYLKEIIADSGQFRILRAGMVLADSATIDSAYINNLNLDGVMTVDSADFGNISVDAIHVKPGATLTIDSATINSATLNVGALTIDSAYFRNAVVGSIIADSATIDSATINHLTLGTMLFDGVELDNAKEFTVKDENGNIELGGYILSTSNTLSVS